MAKKKRQPVEEVVEVEEVVVEEVVEEESLKLILSNNELGLHIREGGELENLSFDGASIGMTDMRARVWKDCEIKNSLFEDVIMQGCDFSSSKIAGNSFINCDFRWATLPAGFKENNEFTGTRF